MMKKNIVSLLLFLAVVLGFAHSCRKSDKIAFVSQDFTDFLDFRLAKFSRIDLHFGHYTASDRPPASSLYGYLEEDRAYEFLPVLLGSDSTLPSSFYRYPLGFMRQIVYSVEIKPEVPNVKVVPRGRVGFSSFDNPDGWESIFFDLEASTVRFLYPAAGRFSEHTFLVQFPMIDTPSGDFTTYTLTVRAYRDKDHTFVSGMGNASLQNRFIDMSPIASIQQTIRVAVRKRSGS